LSLGKSLERRVHTFGVGTFSFVRMRGWGDQIDGQKKTNKGDKVLDAKLHKPEHHSERVQ